MSQTSNNISKTDIQLLRNALLQSLALTTSKAGAQFGAGETGLMGCRLDAALCIGSTKMFHEVHIKSFL